MATDKSIDKRRGSNQDSGGAQSMTAESDIFRDSMGDAKILVQDKIRPQPRRPKPVPNQTLRDELDVIDSLRSGELGPADVEQGDELMFLRPGLKKKLLRRLRRGEFVITNELDLHGYTVETARAALVEFLTTARRSNQTCVRIVHGKGRRSPGRHPVLKSKVHRWLCQREEVLAACVAPPTDGGGGAVYVLLKRA